jgi:hypothetical protein
LIYLVIDISDKVYYLCFCLIVDIIFCVIDIFVINWLYVTTWLLDFIWCQYMIRYSGMYIYYLNKNACTCIILCVALWHHHDGNLCTSNSPLTTVSAGYHGPRVKVHWKKENGIVRDINTQTVSID